MNKYQGIKTVAFILIAIVFIWVYESIIETVFFSQESFADALIFNVPPRDLYSRLLVIIACCSLILVLLKNRIIRNKESQLVNILDNVTPICITDFNFNTVMANNAYISRWGQEDDIQTKCYDQRPGEACHTEKCALKRIQNGAQEIIYETIKICGGEPRYFIVSAKPYLDFDKKLNGMVVNFHDITERKKLEKEKQKLIDKLQSSLDQVKLLSGYIYICANCKKVKDDKGYWNQIEAYVKDHSEAEFSHGICPECAKELYPELNHYKKLL